MTVLVQLSRPPNYREIELPACCGNCRFYIAAGATYDDSPETCEKHDRATFSWLCDDFEKED